MAMNNFQQNTSIYDRDMVSTRKLTLEKYVYVYFFLVQEGKTTTRDCLHCREELFKVQSGSDLTEAYWPIFLRLNGQSQNQALLLHSLVSL